jgi:CRISPR-associated endonuclease/helicase Cas3
METRKAINTLIEKLENGHKKIILEAPTGYGKSSAAPLIYKTIKEKYDENKLIHVLPLRAIVEDIALKSKKSFKNIGFDEISVAYQAGTIISNIEKKPLLDADYTVTTLDSFVHNLFKVPVTEIYNPYKHYYIPITSLFVSAIIFDETHLFTKEEKMFDSFLASLNVISKAMDSPIILMSATLTNSIKQEIKKYLENPIFIRLGEQDKDDKDTIIINDTDFEDSIGSINYEIKEIERKDIINTTKHLIQTGKKVLIIINSIKDVISIFNELNKEYSEKTALIHSKIMRKERTEIIKKLSDFDILVGTSGIEAGVDISFDALITDVSDPSSLVQRIGRVCRNENSCKDGKEGKKIGEIYVIRPEDKEGKNTINQNSIEMIEFLTKYSDKILWRLPYSKSESEYISYVYFIEKFSQYNNSSNPNQNYIHSLAQLFGYAYLPQKSIQAFLNKNKYSLVREALIEIIVGDTEQIKKENEFEFFDNSFSISLSELFRLNKKFRLNKNNDSILTADCFYEEICINKLNKDLHEFEMKCIKDKIFNINKLPENKEYSYLNFVNTYKTSPILVLKQECYKKLNPKSINSYSKNNLNKI